MASLGMAEVASKHVDAFLGAGFQPEFVEQIRGAATRLKDQVDERAALIGRRIAATEGVATEIARGRAIVSFLETLVTPALERAPDLLAEWRTLVRMGRPRRRPAARRLEATEATPVSSCDSGADTSDAVAEATTSDSALPQALLAA